MWCSLSAKFTKLLYLKSCCLFFLILHARIITPFAFCAGDDDKLAHLFSVMRIASCALRFAQDAVRNTLYAIISDTTPAPTVWPPSLIAKRSSFSIAIGIMSSPSKSTLSPGITISTPWDSFAIPVTSVVLK